MAQNVADVVGRTIRLLARVGRCGVRERQQGRHWHGRAISGHAGGNFRKKRGQAEVGNVRGDSRRVGDRHRGHFWKQWETGLTKTHRAWRGEN